MRFRKKTFDVEAIQWTPEVGEIPGVVRFDPELVWDGRKGCYKLLGSTLYGIVIMTSGRWILTLPDGSRCVVSDENFREQFEEVQSS